MIYNIWIAFRVVKKKSTVHLKSPGEGMADGNNQCKHSLTMGII